MTSGCTMSEQFSARHEQVRRAERGCAGRQRAVREESPGICTKDGLHFKLLADTDNKVVADYGSLGNYMGMKLAKRNVPDQS